MYFHSIDIFLQHKEGKKKILQVDDDTVYLL